MQLQEITLDQVIDAFAEGVFVVDTAQRIVLWNRAMELLTGHGADDVIGKECHLLHCGGQQSVVAGLMSAPPADGIPAVLRRECLLRGRSGEQIPVRKNAYFLRDAQGQPVGIVAIVTDLRPFTYLEPSARDGATTRLGRLVGASGLMRTVYERIRLAAAAPTTVLILGETGTGKELAAEAIHFSSARRQGPLVKVNCSALSENLLESELFGHVRGAFTGAVKDKTGRFAAAHGGTIFLDEIGELSPAIQVKLLRVLQEKEIEPVGSAQTQTVDVRIIAATNRNLREQVRAGAFREDLYYRLRVFQIDMPPLRDHREDLPLLLEAALARFRRETGKEINGTSAAVLSALTDYCWPGNIRELENVIEHAFVTCPGGIIGIEHLPPELRTAEARAAECRHRHDPSDHRAPVPELTRERLLAVLGECRWDKSAAARRLGINRSTLWRRMKQWSVPLVPPPASP